MEPGVGMFTVIARVIAAELDIDPLRVSVRRGATDAVPVDHGMAEAAGPCCLGTPPSIAARRLRAALALQHDGPVRVIGVGEYLIKEGDPVVVELRCVRRRGLGRS